MARCEVCGNEYDKSFSVELNGERHVFDSFECAIEALAPQCAHCHCRIIGHGVEGGGRVYCCANCARQAGVSAIADRAPKPYFGRHRSVFCGYALGMNQADPRDKRAATVR